MLHGQIFPQDAQVSPVRRRTCSFTVLSALLAGVACQTASSSSPRLTVWLFNDDSHYAGAALKRVTRYDFDRRFNPDGTSQWLATGPALKQDCYEKAASDGSYWLVDLGAATVLVSRDGGRTWPVVARLPAGTSPSLSTLDGRTAYLTANQSSGQPILRRTVDGGQHWSDVPFPSEQQTVRGQAVLADGTLLISDSQHLYRLPPGAREYAKVPDVPSLWGINHVGGWLAGLTETGDQTLISADGGVTWRPLTLP